MAENPYKASSYSRNDYENPYVRGKRIGWQEGHDARQPEIDTLKEQLAEAQAEARAESIEWIERNAVNASSPSWVSIRIGHDDWTTLLAGLIPAEHKHITFKAGLPIEEE